MLTFQVHCTSAKNRNCPQTTVIYYLPITKNREFITKSIDRTKNNGECKKYKKNN